MQKRGKSATRRKGFKEKMRDKQIKPRREEEKESVTPEEKTPRQKMLFTRYGIWYDKDR